MCNKELPIWIRELDFYVTFYSFNIFYISKHNIWYYIYNSIWICQPRRNVWKYYDSQSMYSSMLIIKPGLTCHVYCYHVAVLRWSRSSKSDRPVCGTDTCLKPRDLGPGQRGLRSLAKTGVGRRRIPYSTCNRTAQTKVHSSCFKVSTNFHFVHKFQTLIEFN